MEKFMLFRGREVIRLVSFFYEFCRVFSSRVLGVGISYV